MSSCCNLGLNIRTTAKNIRIGCHNMDVQFFALLLLCYCKQGWTEDVAASEDGKLPELVRSNISHAAQLTPGDPQTNPAASIPTSEKEENSSEEDTDESCRRRFSSPEIRHAIGSGIMKFGLQLLEYLDANKEQPNVIISPLSVSLALSQLALGARNETEEMLLQSLHAETMPCYQKTLKHLLHHVRKNHLHIASRIYLGSGFQPKQEFLQASLEIYDSEPTAMPELDEINEWVEKSTNSCITDFLSSLPANPVMMLINAVHYKGQWLTRFDPRFTTSEPFYIDKTQMVNVDMMLGPKHPLSVFTHNELDAQVARFPFVGNMSMVVVLPLTGHVNMSAIAANLDISDLYSRFPRERNMQVKLPKFKLDFSQELEEALTSMGLRELFSSPNLAGIAEGPLLVSSVQHKSSMEINEEGAEAAAATSVVISRSNPSFTVNHPFFLALVEDSTQTPLFMGVIANPNPTGPTMISHPKVLLDKTGLPLDKELTPSFGQSPK
ncbi:serpin peptidase inhibitor, clade F (alpha-2 antiplasmin, pigment epithelium derived factor), member 2b [Brachyhypopomus gauderio]|uniref:serpin peptidase inhibitor, clade F (alpha-2 antiplasmin, pigment epithelium derived factor), member 2b n=1 Tax=Brachyhypopomus gauderio TaxID=698409 RepID=UPI004041B9A1